MQTDNWKWNTLIYLKLSPTGINATAWVYDQQWVWWQPYAVMTDGSTHLELGSIITGSWEIIRRVCKQTTAWCARGCGVSSVHTIQLHHHSKIHCLLLDYTGLKRPRILFRCTIGCLQRNSCRLEHSVSNTGKYDLRLLLLEQNGGLYRRIHTHMHMYMGPGLNFGLR